MKWLQRFKRVTGSQIRFWVNGDPYLKVLSQFHDKHHQADPNYHYLEIGTCWFDSLLISKGKVNVGVDPQPSKACKFNDVDNREFRVNVATSDAFFLSYEDANKPYSLVFVDGLHTFEQTTKDVVNVLVKSSQFNSDLLVHDVIPINKWVATPNRSTKFWVGDTYLIAPLLKNLGIDFKIIMAPPSGLLWLKGGQSTKVTKFCEGGKWAEEKLARTKSEWPVKNFEIEKFLIAFGDHLVHTDDLKENFKIDEVLDSQNV